MSIYCNDIFATNDNIRKIKEALKSKEILYCVSEEVEPFLTDAPLEFVKNAFIKTEGAGKDEREANIRDFLYKNSVIWIVWRHEIQNNLALCISECATKF